MRSLSQILKDFLKIKTTPVIDYESIIPKIERKIFNRLKNFLRSTSKDGKLQNRSKPKNLLIKLDRELKKDYLDSGIKEVVDDYTKEFDVFEKLTREYYDATLSSTDRKGLAGLFRDTRGFKAKLIDDVTTALLNPEVFQTNVLNELRDVLFEGITFNESIDVVEDRLKSLILTTEKGGDSKIMRYTRQITVDAIRQYDGTLTEKVRSKYKLDGFSVIGSPKADSRVNSINLRCNKGADGDLDGDGVNKFYGKFDEFKLKGTRGYKVEDLPAIIELMKIDDFPPERRRMRKDGKGRLTTPKGNEGLNFNVTPDTFAIYGTGYGSLSDVIYFKLLPGDDVDPDLKSAIKDL